MGFFYSDDARKTSKASGISVDLINRNSTYFKRLGCKACPLNLAILESPKMLPTGTKYPELYVIGEAPGRNEDDEGEQFVGASGQLLRKYLPDDVKIRWNNSIRCRPTDEKGNNREPVAIELMCCSDKQFLDVMETRPPVILSFGAVPLKLFTGFDSISSARGRAFAINVHGHECWMVPTYHPAFLLRMRGDPTMTRAADEMTDLFQRDIDLAISLLDADPPRTVLEQNVNNGVELLYDPDEIIQALADMAAEPATGFDIETVGIRPYNEDSKILTVSISTGVRTIAFPYRHKGGNFSEIKFESIRKAFKKYLTSGNIIIAHNTSFEMEWVLKEFGIEIAYAAAWEDTMVQAYSLDERGKGALSLDFLCILHFGLHIKDLSHVNVRNLENTDCNSVLEYNALDAKYTFKLWQRQNILLEQDGMYDAYISQVGRIPCLVIAQNIGLVPDTKAAEEMYNVEKIKIKKIELIINSDEDVIRYKKRGNELNPGSNPSLGKFLCDFLGYTECKSPKNAYTVGEEILKDIDHPVADAVLEMRAANKIMSTYLVPYFGSAAKSVYCDGKIHTNYNHALTRTGRLSSSDPNLQNWPKKIISARNVIKAPVGKFMVAFDLGQAEARVIAMASRDRVFCDALWEDVDVHMLWAEKLAKAYPILVGGKKNLNDSTAMKTFRSAVKNQWTFPLFFGSQQISVERALNLEDGSLSELYDEFWETFEGIHRWQDKLIKDYHENGYVESLTGKRRRAPLDRNKIINAPVQNCASDIVVDAMERISRYAIKNNRHDLCPVMNIHDDLTFFLNEDRLEDDIELIAKMMCLCPFPFATIVPITVEVSVGRRWGEMSEVATFNSAKDFGVKRNEDVAAYTAYQT